ncbi:MAG: DUF167 domain-containing protein [Ignavibacteriae bacterium]|nr:DUF167 domain-containing protein [Ignavibacteriota bacterium]
MKIQVVVNTNARRDSVEVREDGSLFVSVNVPPVEGKANKKVVEVLAEYFHKPKSAFTIVTGKTSKKKLIEVS